MKTLLGFRPRNAVVNNTNFSRYTGANVTRNDPPDRYVFNYRPSYSEEAAALVRYLVKLRRIQPRQIALFAQDDSFGNAGFAGVAKAFRALGLNDAAILRANYARNTADVEPAINELEAQKVPSARSGVVCGAGAVVRQQPVEGRSEPFPANGSRCVSVARSNRFHHASPPTAATGLPPFFHAVHADVGRAPRCAMVQLQITGIGRRTFPVVQILS